ncbi:hypothetical protein ACWEQL_00865 [Kitasatospora sp. NPDC004240]
MRSHLRTELLPPPVSPRRLDELRHAIERIADLVLAGSEAADGEIRAFNAATGHDYTTLDFAEYEGSRSVDAFALEAALPARPRVADVTTEELVELVHRILAADPETDHYLRLLGANVPHPGVGGLIFRPPAHLRNASAERIVQEALAYRPFAL